MQKQIEQLTDKLGLEFDDRGNFIIDIVNTDDYKIIADTLSYSVIKELIDHQLKFENYEGAEVLRKVIEIKDGIQKV